ncbi:RNA polymerase sigma factor [Flavivirga spongiicola]|uniref:RNA polymerase sigma factor n=1 Tax=Flavivirga spongiicola TaxID=421621 RepID=A0ABU7XNP4_9FLAO|nr:RNA polymerase sigma-70 factor [Flavivirga sp. MEBiC05379]MDO5977389.1 RNA polymerase sigma-70 factor [Flavivirga sp. MEBiC05379]
MKNSETSMEETLISLKKGNKESFNVIFNTYQKGLYYFIYAITKSKYNTEEILQAVFIKVWTKRATIDCSKSFESFIFTIAKNLTYNHLRAISNRESLRQEVWQNITHISKQTEDELVFSEYTDIVNDILLGIPKQKRSIYILSREEGKSNQEIADLLGISQKTVKNHLWKTLQIIKEQLHPHISTYLFAYFTTSFFF